MLKIETVAKVTYTCQLNKEDEELVLKYIKEHQEELKYSSSEEKITEAIETLFFNDEIELYKHSIESDFVTEHINWSEFEERNADDILNNANK